MTKVKICGLKRIEDIEYVNELQPDYIGLVFANSKRKVELEQAKELISKLNKNIKAVGVFVNEEPDKVRNIAEVAGLHVLQFHGNESYEYMEKFKDFEVWKALKINEDFDFKSLNYDICSKYLLDNVKPGSGETFDWKLVTGKIKSEQIILAGGLTTENVGEGIKAVKPYGVDVSSGVEKDGLKDFYMIKTFIDKVRS